MKFNFLFTKKAASFYAAFLFGVSTMAGAGQQELVALRQKTAELVLQKKKSQALGLLRAHIVNENDGTNKNEVIEMLSEVARLFIRRDSQDAYENSLNQTLSNSKEAMQSVEKCLMLEPDQLDCLIQKTRLQFLNKNNIEAEKTIVEIKKLAPQTQYADWLDLFKSKNRPDFKNKKIIKNLSERKNEESFALTLLELDRSFVAKNYSHAKEIIFYLEKHYSEWPDLIYYRNKLNTESSETGIEAKNKTDAESLVVYKNKCKGLSKTSARKFRYDFELCARGE